MSKPGREPNEHSNVGGGLLPMAVCQSQYL